MREQTTPISRDRRTVDPKTVAGRGVALVTGGRRGIGRAICSELAANGFDIALVDVVDDGMASDTVDMVRGLGRRASFHPADIARIDQHERIINDAERELGPIVSLINNAGIQVAQRGDLLDMSETVFDQLLDVNLKGTFFLTQAVAKRMIRRQADGDERSIITITSANAALVSPEKGPYCISKAGLSMATQQFAVRLAEEGIRVYEIRPGLIRTDMTSEVEDLYTPSVESGEICPMRRWGTPEDVAVGVATLAIGAMPFSTGDIYNIGGGIQIPRL